MRVTSKCSPAMTWLVEFLNLKLNRPTESEQQKNGRFLAASSPPGSIGLDPAGAERLQWKWNRQLAFIMEPKPPARSLSESLQTGIAYHEDLIKTQRGTIVFLAPSLI